LSSNYKKIRSFLPEEDFPFAQIDFCRMMCIVTSTMISVNVSLDRTTKQQELSRAFVPYINYFSLSNKEPDIVWDFSPENNCFVVHATREIKRGEELCDQFLQIDNKDLLL
jgi:hypothetical protein